MKKEKGTWKRVLAKILVFSLVFQLAFPANVMATSVVDDISTEAEEAVTKEATTEKNITQEVVTEEVTTQEITTETVREEDITEESQEVTEETVTEEKIPAEEVPVESVVGAANDDISYQITPQGVITGISGDVGEVLEIPAMIGDITVTEISLWKGLSNKTAIKEVILPEGITSIQGFSGCTSLEKINIPDSVTEIESIAFENCALTSVKLPSVTKVGTSAFKNCKKLTAVTFGKSLTEVGQEAFYGCAALEEVDIESKTDKSLVIYTRAFAGCTNLKKITLADPVISEYSAVDGKIDIYANAFDGVKGCDMRLSANVLLRKNAFAGLQVNALTLNGELTGDSVFGEGDSQFENLSNTYYIDVTGVGSSNSELNTVFSTMAGLKSGAKVVFKGDLTDLDTKAYIWGGDGVAEFELDEESAQDLDYQIIEGALYKENESGLTAIWVPQGMEMEDGLFRVPEGVTAISEGFYTRLNGANYAVAVNKNATNLVLPKSMTTLSNVVYRQRVPITIYLPEDGETKYHISGRLVKQDNYNYNPVKVVLPTSMENYTYDEEAFATVTDLVIPEGMTEFPSDVTFSDIYALNSVEVEEGNTAFKVVDGAIYSADGKVLYWWPIAALDNNAKIEIPEGVEEIASYAFASDWDTNNQYTVTIVLPSTLKEIHDDAIYDISRDTIRVVTNKCSDDVKVGTISDDIQFGVNYLYVKDATTSPFVKVWVEQCKSGARVISGGVATIQSNVLFETEDGKTKRGAVGSFSVKVSKVNGTTSTPVDGDCFYFQDGTIELLVPQDGVYNLEFVPAQKDVYLPTLVENVSLTVASPDETKENITALDVTLDRIPVLRVNAQEDVLGYVFNADGSFNSVLSERTFGLISKGLQPGEYKVLLHKSSHKLMKQNQLSDYATIGLQENVDYVVRDFVIAEFEDSIEDVVMDAPEFDAVSEKAGFVKLDACSYIASPEDARYGYTNLDLVYAIDSEKWSSELEAVNILVTLPDGVSYVDNSAAYLSYLGLPSEECEVTVNDGYIRFTLDKENLEGRIRFAVTSTDTASGVSCAFVEGAAKDFIGAVEFLKNELTIKTPAEFSKGDKIRVMGLAPAGKTVQLFIGNVKVGETVSNSRGAWGSNLEIDDAKLGETYIVTAKIQENSNVASAYDETLCVEKAVKVTNIAYEYYHNMPSKVIHSEVDMDTMIGKRAIETSLTKCTVPFNIYFDIENDEEIEKIYVTHDKGTGYWYNEVVKQEDGRWALLTAVRNEGLPPELTLVAEVKKGDKTEKIEICDFIIQWIIDPSGYIYEAVSENRVEGVTVTIFYKNQNGAAVKWDAEEFGQVNSVTTDQDGNYGWFVPAGQWKVRAEKEGYSTVESDWLPVPPPQLDVNLELVSTKQPKVAGIDLASDKMLVRFDNYIIADSFTKENVALKDATDQAVEITSVEAVDAKERNEKAIAKEFVVTFATALAEGSYTATVAAGVTSYADVVMNESQELTGLAVAGIINDIETPEFFVVQRGKQCTFEVDVLSDESTQDRVLTAISADDSKIKIASVGKVNAQGKATIAFNGQSAGVTEVTLGVENSSFTKTVSVMVIDNETVFDKMFEQNNLAKPQVSDKNNNENKPSVPGTSVDIAKAVVTGIENKVYTGTAITQEVKVAVDGKVLVKDTDYTVTYKNNTEAGTAEVVITGKGNYKGTKTVSFTIAKADTTARFEKDVYKKAYGAKKFTVKVVDAAGAVTFKSSSSKVAKIDKKGKVTIKGTGRAVITATIAEGKNYKAGTVETVIEVSPKKASIKKLSAKKTQLTVTWKKDKRATGYEVKYSTSKKFKKAKTVLVKKTKTTKTTLKKLKKGKTYYVKVRAYKEVKVGNKKVKIYSPYSKTLKKKIK